MDESVRSHVQNEKIVMTISKKLIKFTFLLQLKLARESFKPRQKKLAKHIKMLKMQLKLLMVIFISNGGHSQMSGFNACY